MTEFERLGKELRQQLHAAVDDLQPSAELTANVDAIPSGHGAVGLLGRLGRRPRRIAFALPVPIAAIVAAARGPVRRVGRHAVIRQRDHGSAQWRGARLLSELGDVGAANAGTPRASHPQHAGRPDDRIMSVPKRLQLHRGSHYESAAAPVVTLTPRTIAPGSTVVLAAKRIGRDTLVRAAFAPFKGKLPTCASVIRDRSRNGQRKGQKADQ